ncbi:MAG: helix-turn-helix domain-containing protein [Halieaceae bacterium]|jgi:AraC-like DNA-binding protein|nr:helix-turn-helix domain-containing protein [Halieaceae bacterium]
MASTGASGSASKDNGLEDIVRGAHVAVDIGRQGKPIKHFTCRELPLGKLELFDIFIDPIAIYRRSEDIDKDANDDILLATQVEGTVLIRTGDSEFTQHPGSLVIMSAAEPYTIIHTQESHRLILHIPNQVYRDRVLGQQEGIRFRPRLMPVGGLVSIVHQMLKALAFEADNLQTTEQYTLAESLLQLTSALLRSEADQEYEQHHAKQSALFRRIIEFMEANFTDCELTPEKIATANGISMRYLHSLFHQAGMTVSKWMWERRLKATREDLLDPGMGHRRVSEIAFRRGFNDPAHFSRAFKKRFDLSPSRLRQLALEQGAGAS